MTRNFLSENLNVDDLDFANITCMNQKCSSGSEENQRVIQFNLFTDEDGVIRCKGRLNNADITQQSKNAVLLPARHIDTQNC